MKFTFARVLMILCVVLSGGLGVIAYNQHQDITSLRSSLGADGDVEDLARQIQQYSKQLSGLLKQRDGDPLTGGEKTPESYIRAVAYDKRVALGTVDFSPNTRDYGTFVDKVIRVTSTEKDLTFSRNQLANFFFKLEEGSKRVRVTQIELETASKKVESHEIPEDRWLFKADVTLRQKAEK